MDVCSKTISNNYITNFLELVAEYELVKDNKSDKFSKATEFYNYHGIKRQTFLKYYTRFKLDGDIENLLPQKRGPKFVKISRKFDSDIENQIISLRKDGYNKYEIYQSLKQDAKSKKKQKEIDNNKSETLEIPSTSSIYRIFKKTNLNILNQEIRTKKVRKIIKDSPGDLGHIDVHYLPHNIIENQDSKKDKYYVIGIIDDASRIAWLEVIGRITALDTMFASLGIINKLYELYHIKFKAMLSDNGVEFKSESKKENTFKQHPFERLLLELGIKHKYTKPYRPQTNGKIERLWKTFDEDVIKGSKFKDEQELQDVILRYNFYYNEHRIHQGINSKTPREFLEELQFKSDDSKPELEIKSSVN